MVCVWVPVLRRERARAGPFTWRPQPRLRPRRREREDKGRSAAHRACVERGVGRRESAGLGTLAGCSGAERSV